MEFELNDFALTIAIGILATWGIVFLSCCFSRRFNRFLKEVALTTPNNRLVMGIVYLILAFAFGILIEDVSKNIVASRSCFSIFSPWAFNDNYYRALALNHSEIHTRLLKDLWKHDEVKAIVKYHTPQAVQTVDSILAGAIKGKAITDLLMDCSPPIYYKAKNRVFFHGTYNQELSKYVSRGNFCRSLFFLSVLFALVYTGCLLGVLYRNKWKKGKVGGRLFSLMIMTAIWFVLALVSIPSYKSEQTNFNLRVYGYYDSLLDRDEAASGRHLTIP